MAPATKSLTTASTAIPAPLSKIPVWPVPTNFADTPFLTNELVVSHAVVIFPTSQSVPTVNSMGVLRFFHDPFVKGSGSGGLRKSVMVTLCLFASLENSGSKLKKE